MKPIAMVILFFMGGLVNNQALAFVDKIAVSPLAPHAGQQITISFRFGECDAPVDPLTWTLQGNGEVRDLIVNGVHELEPLFCFINIDTISIPLGALPSGDYEIHVKIRDPLDGIGGIPSPSYGSVQFTVGQARSIPSQGIRGSLIAVLLLLAAAWRTRKSNGLIRGGSLLVLVGALLPAPTCKAQRVAWMERSAIRD